MLFYSDTLWLYYVTIAQETSPTSPSVTFWSLRLHTFHVGALGTNNTSSHLRRFLTKLHLCSCDDFNYPPESPCHFQCRWWSGRCTSHNRHLGWVEVSPVSSISFNFPVFFRALLLALSRRLVSLCYHYIARNECKSRNGVIKKYMKYIAAVQLCDQNVTIKLLTFPEGVELATAFKHGFVGRLCQVWSFLVRKIFKNMGKKAKTNHQTKKKHGVAPFSFPHPFIFWGRGMQPLHASQGQHCRWRSPGLSRPRPWMTMPEVTSSFVGWVFLGIPFTISVIRIYNVCKVSQGV